MKNLLIITMLLGIGYSQCNESNWQDYYPDMQYCDLSYAILFYANLSNANLSGADLRYANLSYANLSCANLSGANLSNTDLYNTTWDECGITDEDGDGYDDVSYEAGANSVIPEDGIGQSDVDAAYVEGYEAGAGSVDTDAYFDDGYVAGVSSGDHNLDGNLDILDVVYFVQQILYS